MDYLNYSMKSSPQFALLMPTVPGFAFPQGTENRGFGVNGTDPVGDEL